MAQFLLRNSLNPRKVVRLGITFRQIVLTNTEGDPYWLIEIKTDEPHKNGGSIPPEYIHVITLNDLDSEIEKASAVIATKVDWTPSDEDLRSPFVESCTITDGDQDVAIESVLTFRVKDIFPAVGVDLSSISLTINGLDVSNGIKILGDIYDCFISWQPSIIAYDTYD